MLLCRGCFLGSSVVDATPTRTPLFLGLILVVVVAVLMVLLLWLCCVDRIDMTAVSNIRDSLLIQQPFLHACAHAHAHANLHHPNIHRHRHTRAHTYARAQSMLARTGKCSCHFWFLAW